MSISWCQKCGDKPALEEYELCIGCLAGEAKAPIGGRDDIRSPHLSLWRSIKHAPRDGRPLLLWWPKGYDRPAVAWMGRYWKALGRFEHSFGIAVSTGAQPTHFIDPGEPS